MTCHVIDLGEVFDYLVAHGRMKEKEARVKFRQVCKSMGHGSGRSWPLLDLDGCLNVFCMHETNVKCNYDI